ncbi:MAG: hypothetical protein U9O82_08230 [Thermodesulfobacteriota bacterium]|nr:hypothetical protein [Thermodesulfobacteriota bacterium]
MRRWGLCLYSMVFCLILTSCVSMVEPHKRAVKVPETVDSRAEVPIGFKDQETLVPEMTMKPDFVGRFAEIPLKPLAGGETIGRVKEVVKLPGLGHVDKRLAVYEKKLAEWMAVSDQIDFLDLDEAQPGEWAGCAGRLDRVVSAYSLLRQRILDRGYQSVDSGIENEDPWEVFRLDIEYLESGCDTVLDEGPPASLLLESFKAESLEYAETIVHQYAQKEASEEVVRAFENLKEIFPEKKLTPLLKQKYGLALLRTGRVDESVAVLLDILEDFKKGDAQSVLSGRICSPVSNFSGAKEIAPLSFKCLAADLLLVNGRIEEAKTIYQELQDYRESCREHDQWVAGHLSLIESGDEREEELNIFRSVLKIYLSFDGRHVPSEMNTLVEKLEYLSPESEFARSAGLLLRKVEEQVRAWIIGQLETVDGLVDGKEYSEARFLVDAMLDGEIPDDMRDMVENAFDNVVIAEAQDREARRQLMDQALSARWDEAINLLDLRKYDDAIHAFSALVETNYDEKAAIKIKEASNLAAAELRRTAATLFVKARKTTETNRKAELLFQSRQLLLKILEQYPRTDIIDKVRQNLEVLESQILKIDPFILLDESGDKNM